MPPIVSHLDIARPPAEVFGYATDPSRFAEWQDDVVGVRIQGGRPLGVGSRFTTTRRVARLEFSYTQEITRSIRPAAGPLAVSMDRSGQARASPSSRLRRAAVQGHLHARVPGEGDRQAGAGRRPPAGVEGAPKSYQHLKERLERGDWRAAGRAGAMPPANRP